MIIDSVLNATKSYSGTAAEEHFGLNICVQDGMDKYLQMLSGFPRYLYAVDQRGSME